MWKRRNVAQSLGFLKDARPDEGELRDLAIHVRKSSIL